MFPDHFFFFFTLYVDKYTNKGIYWREYKSDIASRLVHKESKLMFTLSGQNDQRKKSFFLQCKLTLIVWCSTRFGN